MTTTSISPFTSPSSYLTDQEIQLLKQYATRDSLKQRPSHDLPVRISLDPTNTFNDLQRDIAALITYYTARRLSFTIEQDLVNYSITMSRRVVLPGIIAVWLDILKAEVVATTTAEYESLCSQARRRFNQVTSANTFSDYARSRYQLKGNDQLKDFDHWFERFTEYDNFNPVEGDKQPQYPKPLHTFRHRKRIRIEQQKAARANQKPGRKGRKPDPSVYWGWMEPYETYQEFARADRPRFVMVVNNGLDILEQKFGIKFTREYILERAKYCRNKREFSLNNTGLMVIVNKLGLQNELIQMLECVPGRRFLLDKEQVTEPDPELDTLIEQVSTDETTTPAKLLDPSKGRRRINCHTVESITVAIKQYSSRKELRRRDRSLYESARRMHQKGLIDMDDLLRGKGQEIGF
ncbi:hypothetical protein I6M44_14810 [Shewanella algae]|uniref:hypothetical protein n=1 Tax=Shewanella algae TaxID=38313 RepID=UPI001AADBBD2|nr:hypothetical protein [Shewanella algae]MBO2625319.1 hypothetical protein [Shewanella algae]